MDEPYLKYLREKIEISIRNNIIQALQDTKNPITNALVVAQVIMISSRNYLSTYEVLKNDMNEEFLSQSEFQNVIEKITTKLLAQINNKPFSNQILDDESVKEKKAVELIAFHYKCTKFEAKDYFLRELRLKKYDIPHLKTLINEFNSKIPAEANDLKLEYEFTPSFVLSKWVKEYINTGAFKDRIRTEAEVYSDFFDSNPELEKLYKNGKPIEEILSPDQLRELFTESIDSINPGLKYLEKAVEKVYKEKNYYDALLLINKGLSIEPKLVLERYYMIRATCYAKLEFIEEALQDLEKAKELIINTYGLSDMDDFYKNEIHNIDINMSSLKNNGNMKT